MRAAFLVILREWYIAAIGIFAILAGLYFVSGPSANSGLSAQATLDPSAQTQSKLSTQNVATDSARNKDALTDKVIAPVPAQPAKPSRSATRSGSDAPLPSSGTASLAQPSNASSHDSHTMASAAPPVQTVAQASSQPTTGAPTGDPSAGRQVYRKCQACHSLESGKNGLGPSLAGIFGKKSGEVSSYNYSSAMRDANSVWDAATLDAYLLDPQETVPKNKMPFPGLKTWPDGFFVPA